MAAAGVLEEVEGSVGLEEMAEWQLLSRAGKLMRGGRGSYDITQLVDADEHILAASARRFPASLA